MSSAYQVMDAQEVRRLPAKDHYPEKAVDHMTLKQDGMQVLVTAFRKVGDPLPAVGSTIEGELGENDRFDKDRRKFKAQRSGGWGGGTRKRDPGEIWAIQRQHSQEMALRYIASKVALFVGKKPQPVEMPNFDFDISDVWKLTDAFQRDLDPSPTLKSDVPFDDGGLPPTTLP